MKFFTLLFYFISFQIFAQYNYNQGGSEKHFYEEIPFESRGKVMVIKVNINGKNEDFVFDTGMPNLLYKDKVKGKKTKLGDGVGNVGEVAHDKKPITN